MALVPRFVQSSPPYLSPTFICHLKPSFLLRENPEKVPKSNFTRRIGAIATMAKVLLAREAIFNVKIANGFDLKMVAPGQTLEEAESGIRGHALALLQVKALIESEAWKDMQKALRKSSSLLKQDIYTIIQSKPGSMRPQLRKLYSNLFNNVTRLDYAARDNDATQVWEYYEKIVITLDDILSRI
ncbi:psbQ-like protein 3, chloroplastic [Vitis riparia]|uniref:psbQ-like protein 3, chloroplastic n=1 Tax=Vitis riparia TaxID=96939 RepID=UPI00155A6CA9|nr:psbQ-like protein 3, chloroplastic [Vitis riparia]XP_034701203.1 psbQ-like protein 3, chloroplastic [Vitis riparia]